MCVLRWYKIINLRVQINSRLVSNLIGAMRSDRADPSRPLCANRGLCRSGAASGASVIKLALEMNASSKTEGRSREFRITRTRRNGACSRKTEAGNSSHAFEISVTIDRSVICEEDALCRAIRHQAGLSLLQQENAWS